MKANERVIVKEAIPALQATAAMLLPGMKHARSMLDVSIHVLQYFESRALTDSANGTLSVPLAAERTLLEEAENVKAMLTAFGRLNDKRN